jgi:hypothetical protein
MRWLVVAALFLGCKDKQQPAPKRDDAAPPPIDAAIADAPVDAAPPDAHVMATEITSTGVGPLTAKHVRFADFKKLLVGLTVTADRQEGEDFAYDEYIAKKGDKQILRAIVQDRSLFKIEVHDPMFATSAGVAVGMKVAQAAERMKDLRCVFETYDPEDDAERVDRSLRCQSASLPQVMFEIDLDGFDGPVGKVSPKQIGSRAIVEIVWLAPHG